MTAQDMHDFLRRRYRRRSVLRGAVLLGAGAAIGPVLWRQSGLTDVAPIGPRWVSFGQDPASQMWVSWSSGTASGGYPAPPAPQVRWGLDSSYGSTAQASSAQVPVPAVAGEPAENTYYNRVSLTGLAPGTTYHYSVSNDGVSWSPDRVFTTAAAGKPDFRFTAFGDEAASSARAAPMAALAASLKPAFHLVAGDLAYATPHGLRIPDVTGFQPAQWDRYLRVVGGNAAMSVPWHPAVGAHEVEPLDDNGYAGFITRFAQPYNSASGSPVVGAFSYGNVAVIRLDGNDLSAQEPINNGYTGGAQTAWLQSALEGYRAQGSGIDFIVVVCNCCCYSSNTVHGSDAGLRDVWGPLFDQYQVDLVISGHVHAYERTNPMRAFEPTMEAAPGSTVRPAADGTTYICAGGGGNGLYRTWYGSTGSGDGGSTAAPRVWQWSGGATAVGGIGKPVDVVDKVRGYSAVRRAVFCCLAIDVSAPAAAGHQTTMTIRTLMPAQTASAVTSIADPAVIDSVTLVRTAGQA